MLHFYDKFSITPTTATLEAGETQNVTFSNAKGTVTATEASGNISVEINGTIGATATVDDDAPAGVYVVTFTNDGVAKQLEITVPAPPLEITPDELTFNQNVIDGDWETVTATVESGESVEVDDWDGMDWLWHEGFSLARPSFATFSNGIDFKARFADVAKEGTVVLKSSNGRVAELPITVEPAEDRIETFDGENWQAGEAKDFVFVHRNTGSDGYNFSDETIKEGTLENMGLNVGYFSKTASTLDGQKTVTLTPANNTPAGDYVIIFKDNNANEIKIQIKIVEAPAPDFSVSPNAVSITLGNGTDGASTGTASCNITGGDNTVDAEVAGYGDLLENIAGTHATLNSDKTTLTNSANLFDTMTDIYNYIVADGDASEQPSIKSVVSKTGATSQDVDVSFVLKNTIKNEFASSGALDMDGVLEDVAYLIANNTVLTDETNLEFIKEMLVASGAGEEVADFDDIMKFITGAIGGVVGDGDWACILAMSIICYLIKAFGVKDPLSETVIGRPNNLSMYYFAGTGSSDILELMEHADTLNGRCGLIAYLIYDTISSSGAGSLATEPDITKLCTEQDAEEPATFATAMREMLDNIVTNLGG